MKQVLAISLLLCMCFQCVLKLGIVAWYQANKTYVATVLCENKNQPQKKCNGKCYLRKQLNKTENNENHNNSQQKSQTPEWVDFMPVENISITLHNYQESNTHHSIYTAPAGHHPLLSIFHPPPVA